MNKVERKKNYNTLLYFIRMEMLELKVHTNSYGTYHFKRNNVFDCGYFRRIFLFFQRARKHLVYRSNKDGYQREKIKQKINYKEDNLAYI